MVEPAAPNTNEPDEFVVEPEAGIEDVADPLADLVEPMSRGEMSRNEVAQLRACAALILHDLAERDKGVVARNNGAKSQGRVAFGREYADEAGLAFFVPASHVSAGIAEEYEAWEEKHDDG